MVMNLGVLKGKIASVVQDNTGLLDQSTGGDIDNAISEALEVYDDDAPRYVVADLVGNACTGGRGRDGNGKRARHTVDRPVGSR